jgi:hypothetical protein
MVTRLTVIGEPPDARNAELPLGVIVVNGIVIDVIDPPAMPVDIVVNPVNAKFPPRA